jgi:hypothetical protein
MAISSDSVCRFLPSGQVPVPDTSHDGMARTCCFLSARVVQAKLVALLELCAKPQLLIIGKHPTNLVLYLNNSLLIHSLVARPYMTRDLNAANLFGHSHISLSSCWISASSFPCPPAITHNFMPNPAMEAFAVLTTPKCPGK